MANDTSVEEFSYQGDYDNQIVDAVNSAKVNVAYNNCLSEDSFGGTQIIEVTNVLFSLYTLRGDYYRNPVDLILNMYS